MLYNNKEDEDTEDEAFKGIINKATIKVPKNKLKTYTKLFVQKGLSKKVKVKSL